MSDYATIVADPPWKQPSGGPRPKTTGGAGRPFQPGIPSRLPYPTMTLDEIKALPVESLAAKDAHLYLWTTNYYLEDSYSVARAWGFQPSTVLVWAKTPRGLGMGGAFTVTAEYVLFCRRGSLAFRNKQDRNWWNWKRGAHSAKPEAFLDLVEAVSPGPYLELFARRNRMGWSAWGNEAITDVEMPA